MDARPRPGPAQAPPTPRCSPAGCWVLGSPWVGPGSPGPDPGEPGARTCGPGPAQATPRTRPAPRLTLCLLSVWRAGPWGGAGRAGRDPGPQPRPPTPNGTPDAARAAPSARDSLSGRGRWAWPRRSTLGIGSPGVSQESPAPARLSQWGHVRLRRAAPPGGLRPSSRRGLPGSAAGAAGPRLRPCSPPGPPGSRAVSSSRAGSFRRQGRRPATPCDPQGPRGPARPAPVSTLAASLYRLLR